MCIRDRAAPGLVVAEPRYGRDLQPLIGAWGVDLDVEGPVVALAEVAGADFEGSMRQAERGHGVLGPGHHGVEQRWGLLGRGVGEHLDLVELVAPQQPTRVAPRRAGLTAVTG